MPERKEPDEEGERPEFEEPERRERRRRGRPPGRRREDRGDDPRAHARIIERRWRGSPPPTAERYAQALRQWQALPGAVVSPATDVTAAGESQAAADENPASGGSASEESAP
jgi:hypothetical protein